MSSASFANAPSRQARLRKLPFTAAIAFYSKTNRPSPPPWHCDPRAARHGRGAGRREDPEADVVQRTATCHPGAASAESTTIVRGCCCTIRPRVAAVVEHALKSATKGRAMFRIVVPLVVAVLATFAAQVFAQVPAGDVAAGRDLVTARCRTCHAVDGPPPASRQQAPSLVAVAQMPSTTSLSLHAFLLTPHPRMPNYRLTPQEIDEVVAYILSLRRRL